MKKFAAYRKNQSTILSILFIMALTFGLAASQVGGVLAQGQDPAQEPTEAPLGQVEAGPLPEAPAPTPGDSQAPEPADEPPQAPVPDDKFPGIFSEGSEDTDTLLIQSCTPYTIWPKDNIYDTSPLFIWSACPNVTGSELKVYKGFDLVFSMQFGGSICGATCQTDQVTNLTPGDYKWLVREEINGNDWGDWTTFREFTVASPTTKTVTFTALGSYDGWVLESASTSSKGGSKNSIAATLSVGDDAKNRQYRSILHFNTATLPNTAVITAVRMRVKRAGIVGTNPFLTHGSLYADMRKGAFSYNAALQLTDWQAPASKLEAGKVSKTATNYWHTLYLASSNFGTINKLGVTQFRLRFFNPDNCDNSADYVNFYSGNAPSANRPKLIVTYYVP